MKGNSFTLKEVLDNGSGYGVHMCIPIKRNRMASCSYGPNIIIWRSTFPYLQIKTLKGHKDNVQALLELPNLDLLISTSTDGLIKFWNTNSFNCDLTIKNPRPFGITLMKDIGNDRFAISFDDDEHGTVMIINTKTHVYDIYHTYYYKENDENTVLSMVMLDNWSILCGCSDGRACRLNLIDGKTDYKTKDFLHKEAITSMLPYGQRLFLTAEKTSIKLWQY